MTMASASKLSHTTHPCMQPLFTKKVARLCPLQDVARFHLLCRAWYEGLEQSASFYPEVQYEA